MTASSKYLPFAVSILVLVLTLPGAGVSAKVQGGWSGTSPPDLAKSQPFDSTLSIAEWLGPMAPVALSPFFGITCLSGLSLFGGGWISRVSIGTIKARSKCTLETVTDGWTLTCQPWLRPVIRVVIPVHNRPVIHKNLFSNRITISDPAAELTFSRLFNASLPELAFKLNATLSADPVTDHPVKTEFA